MAAIDKIYITRKQYPEFKDYIQDLGNRHNVDIVSSLRTPDMFEYKEDVQEFPVAVFPLWIDVLILEDRDNCPKWIYEYVCNQYGLKEILDKESFEELDYEIHVKRLKSEIEGTLLCRYSLPYFAIKDLYRAYGVVVSFDQRNYKGASIEIAFEKIEDEFKYTIDYFTPNKESSKRIKTLCTLDEVLSFFDKLFNIMLNPLVNEVN